MHTFAPLALATGRFVLHAVFCDVLVRPYASIREGAPRTEMFRGS